MVRPPANQPVYIIPDRFDILTFLFSWICVIHSQVADAGEFSGDTEIETDRFRVSDMKITIRFGWESGMDLWEILRAQIGGHDIADEIGRCNLGCAWCRHKDFGQCNRHLRGEHANLRCDLDLAANSSGRASLLASRVFRSFGGGSAELRPPMVCVQLPKSGVSGFSFFVEQRSCHFLGQRVRVNESL